MARQPSNAVKHSEDLRRTILDASLDLIAKKGLESFSMREVARRAGVSHQAPYHYFADREAILAEIVAEGFAQLRDDMLKALNDAGDARARLTAIGNAYIAFALSHPAHFKLMFRSELVRQERHESADVCAKSAFDVLVATVNNAVGDAHPSEGPTGGVSPHVLAAWSLAHGLATLLIEGKLDQYCGKSRQARTAAAESVLRTFEVMIPPRRK